MEPDKSVMGKKVGRKGRCVACGLEKPATFVQFFDSSTGVRNKLSKLVERWADIDFACTGGALCRNCHRRAAYIDGRASQFAKSCMTHGYQRYGGMLMTGMKLPKEVYDHWRRVGVAENLTSDSDIAIFLLQQYESPTKGILCSTCDTPVKLTRVVCSSCKQKTTLQTANVQEVMRETSHPTEPSGKDSFTISLLSSTTCVKTDFQQCPQNAANGSVLLPPISQDNSTPASEQSSVPHLRVSDIPESFEDSQTTCASRRGKVSKDTSMESNHDGSGSRSGSSGEKHLADHDYVMPSKGFKLTPAMFTVKGEKVFLPDAELLVHARGETSSCKAHRFILPNGPLPRAQKDRFSFLPCKVCSCCFNSNAALQLHMQSHKLGGTFRCQFCDLTFRSTDDKAQHEEIHEHPHRKKYVCHLCERTLQSSAGFIAHLKSHCRKPPGPFACLQCDRTFTRRFGLQEHMRVHSGAKPYCCKVCDKSFRWPNKLRDHMRSTHSSEDAHRFVCETCGKRFLQNWLLKHHMRLHREEPVCVCELCGKGFYNQTSLWTHLELQHNDKTRMTQPVICEHCAGEFSSKTVLSAHQRKSSCMAKRRHREGSKPHMRTPPSAQLRGGWCAHKRVNPFGPTATSSHVSGRCSREMQVHFAGKTLQEPDGTLTCIDCGQQFEDESNLVVHINHKHPGETPEKCTSSEQSFSSSNPFMSTPPSAQLRGGQREYKRAQDLETLMLEHSSETETSTTCQQCGQFFLTVAQWDAHLKYAHGMYTKIRKKRTQNKNHRKYHQCKVCGKVMTEAQGLKRHMLTHSGERPFKCSECPAAFRDRQSWRHHIQCGHKPECKPYVCEICGISYRSRYSLRQHRKKTGHGVVSSVTSSVSATSSEIIEVDHIRYLPQSSVSEISSNGQAEIAFVSEAQSLLADGHREVIFISDCQTSRSATQVSCDGQVCVADAPSSLTELQICVSESAPAATQMSDAVHRGAAFISQASSNEVVSLSNTGMSEETNSVQGPVGATQDVFVTETDSSEVTFIPSGEVDPFSPRGPCGPWPTGTSGTKKVNQIPLSSTVPSTHLVGEHSGSKWVNSVPGVSRPKIICMPQAVSGREVMFVPESGRDNVPCSVVTVDPSTLPDTENNEGQIGLWVLI